MKTETIKLIPGREDVTLTTYIRDPFPVGMGPEKRPAVIVCPGGAYMSLSDHEGEPVALAFNHMGYHAFVLKYSVYGDMDPAISAEKMPVHERSVHPGPMRDIGRALVCIQEHAKEWNVDGNKIAICGFSAGAHNCAMYSVYWDKPVLQEYFGVEKEWLRPAACVLGYTLSDYVYMKEAVENASPQDQMFFDCSNKCFMGADYKKDDLLDEISPARHVDANTPPTFLWATAEDTMVPVEHTLRMASALGGAGVPFELHVFEKGPHGISLGTNSSAAAKSRRYPDVAKWLSLCETWLEKYLEIDMPERTQWDAIVAENIGK